MHTINRTDREHSRNFDVQLNVNNIFDKEYFVGGIGLGTAGGYNLAVPGEPRTYGVDLSFRF